MTLSEKIFILSNMDSWGKEMISVDDVKEFIILLKETIEEENLGFVTFSMLIDDLYAIIDKLAGEKLS